MILRNKNTGEFDVYDIVNNQSRRQNSLGTVGLDWSVGGLRRRSADPIGHIHGYVERSARTGNRRLRRQQRRGRQF